MRSAEIKEAREAAGLSQKEMSDRLHIPRRTIEDWERGVREPAAWVAELVTEKLKKMAKKRNGEMSLKKIVNAARFAAFEQIKNDLGEEFNCLPDGFSIYKIADFKKAEYMLITDARQLNSVNFKEHGIENPEEVRLIAHVNKKTRQAWLYD